MREEGEIRVAAGTVVKKNKDDDEDDDDDDDDVRELTREDGLKEGRMDNKGNP